MLVFADHRFRLGWRNVSDRLEAAAIVEPIDLFEGGEIVEGLLQGVEDKGGAGRA